MGTIEEMFSDSHGHVKQKKRVVDPTRNTVAAVTGTYRLGRNGRGGAEAGPPTPPPIAPPLKPGIRDEAKRQKKLAERYYQKMNLTV